MLRLKEFLKKTRLFNLWKETPSYYKYCFIRWKYSLWKEYYDSHYQRATNNEKMVVAMIDGRLRHGGLADRLRSLIGVYYHCKKYGIDFRIHWVYPFNLENFLEPNTIDWRITDKLSYNSKDTIPQVYYAYWIGKDVNRETERATFKKLNVKYRQVHFYGYLHTPNTLYAPLFQELFKLSSRLREEIESYLKNLDDNYVSMTFRFQNLLGDFNEGNYPVLNDVERKKLIDKCKLKLIEIVPDKRKRILVTSDSTTFLDEVSNLDFVYTVPGVLCHMDFLKESNLNSNSVEYNVHKKAFIDFFMIANAKQIYLLQTDYMYDSLFPYTASLLMGKEYVKVKF